MTARKKLKRLAFLAALAISLPGCAQDKTFDEMVDGLIDKSVPLVQPADCAGDTGVVFLDARELRELFKQGYVDVDQAERFGDIEVVWNAPEDASVESILIDAYDG